MAVTAAIFVYLLFQLAIGAFVSRRIASENDYLLAGRSLGLGLASFSIFATWFGAETCMGSAAAIYEDGLAGSRADPFGYTICLLLMAIFLASPLWKKKVTTLADFFRERYSPSIEKLSVWLLVPTSLFWAAAQIKAFGHIVTTITPFSIDVCVTMAAFFVIAYTAFGGLWGDVITDFLQGIILMIGLVVMFVYVVSHVGSGSDALPLIDPAKLSFTSPGESLLERIDAWMVPILGSLVAQEVLQRMFASRNEQVAKNASFVASGIYLMVGLIPVAFGLLGHHFSLHLEDPDQFLPVLAKTLMPGAMFVIFCGALISAILSTVDSALLASGSLISHNFLCTFFPKVSEKGKVKAARLCVVVSGLFAYVMALYGGSIYDLLVLTSSLGTAGVLVITLFGLFSGFGNSKAAACALVVGLVMTPLSEYVFGFSAPFLSSIALSAVTFLFVGALEVKRLVPVRDVAP